jgi:hypothetical protein
MRHKSDGTSMLSQEQISLATAKSRVNDVITKSDKNEQEQRKRVGKRHIKNSNGPKGARSAWDAIFMAPESESAAFESWNICEEADV